MKYFWIPAAVLSLLLAASLWNAAAIDRAVAPWCDALTEARSAAEQEDWDAAARLVRETREAWDARRGWLHIVAAHDELEAADMLFAAAEGWAANRDAAEFCEELAELRVQLCVVAEMQQLSLHNIL